MTLLAIILQIALEAFINDPGLSGGSLCNYHPQDTLTSAAPEDYSPFYISHIARHGSRYITKGSSHCFHVIDTLDMFAKKGMLTEDGLALLKDLRMLHDISKGNFGALTELGDKEHRQICSRMARHYPEVFSDGNRRQITAYSTDSPRVIASMEAFLSELSGREDGLEVTTYKTSKANCGKAGKEVRGRYVRSRDREKYTKKEKDFSSVAKEIRKGYNLKTFAGRIFQDPSKVRSATLGYVARNSFVSLKTGGLTDPEVNPGPGKYFTAEELYYLWLPQNLQWARYLNAPGYESPFTRARGRGILKQIVDDADKALSEKSPAAATLRFSHDSYLFPIMITTLFEGTYLECSDQEIPEFFQDYRYVCTACNVQLIFYRSEKSDDILVKLLLNEKETPIRGLAPTTGVYYDWKALKKFWKQTTNL